MEASTPRSSLLARVYDAKYSLGALLGAQGALVGRGEVVAVELESVPPGVTEANEVREPVSGPW